MEQKCVEPLSDLPRAPDCPVAGCRPAHLTSGRGYWSCLSSVPRLSPSCWARGHQRSAGQAGAPHEPGSSVCFGEFRSCCFLFLLLLFFHFSPALVSSEMPCDVTCRTSSIVQCKRRGENAVASFSRAFLPLMIETIKQHPNRYHSFLKKSRKSYFTHPAMSRRIWGVVIGINLLFGERIGKILVIIP